VHFLTFFHDVVNPIAFQRQMCFIDGKLKSMPTKIEEKTREFCQTIVEQPEMASIRRRIDAFLADAGARGQYETVMSKGNALHEKQHNGQTLDGVEIADFEKHRDELLKNPAARGFLDAQEELHGASAFHPEAGFQNFRAGPRPERSRSGRRLLRPWLRLPSLTEPPSSLGCKRKRRKCFCAVIFKSGSLATIQKRNV
jgi:cell fate (sporulation/competence/biofilm development) regulator YlbF (YheA/YmcA/DUF963 family)